MAFYGKTWPIGLAPGMGINAFVAFGVCAGMGYTPQQALGAVLVAGVLFLIISLTPIRAWLINSIPRSLKLGIGAGIGLFLAIIGFEIMGLTDDHPVTLVTLGDIKNPFYEINQELAVLYKDAASGECPVIHDPSRQTCAGSRFGCWTCTVVDVDSSLREIIGSD